MGLLSFLHKNKQESRAETREFHSRAEEESNAVRGRAKRGAGHAGAGREAVDPVLPEKKRARRRLIGAVALVLAVIIGLPMVLDSEPKPLAGDVSIQIPARDKPFSASSGKPQIAAADALDSSEEIVDTANAGNTGNASTAAKPAPRITPTIPATTAPATTASAVNIKPAPVEKRPKPPDPVTNNSDAEEIAPHIVEKPARQSEVKVLEAKPAKPVKPENKPETRPESKPETRADKDNKPDSKPARAETRAEARPIEHDKPARPEPRRNARSEESLDEAARANAILEGKPAEVTHAAKAEEKPARPQAREAKQGKIVLQVAAFASQDKVDELQGKLREAGIRSYAQKVATGSGEKTRVRVGPFADKEEADRARAKLQSLGLSGTLVTQ